MQHDLKRLQRQHVPQQGEAARVGEELRQARLAIGLTVEELAQRLRIRRAHLEALEDGRLGDLPGAAYAVGFVRAYAAGLGLDADEMVRRFRDLSGPAVTRKTDLVFPEPVPERGVPAGAVIAMGAVLCFGAYVAWFNWTGQGNRSVDVVPPIPPRLEAAAEQGRAQLPREGGTFGGPVGSLPLSALPPPGGQAGANTSAQAGTLPAAPLRAPEPPAPPPVLAAPAAPPPPADPLIPMEGARILLRAKPGNPEGSWVQVRDPRSGQVMLNRVLRPGETWPVPARDGLSLDTGKADGLDIVVEGRVTPALDGLVGVRRNIPLEAERLRAGPLGPTGPQRQAAAPN